MTRALVTGASGHLGANLVRDLLDHGYEVVPFVRSGSNLSGLKGLDLNLFYGDLLRRDTVMEAAGECDIIFHAGAPYRIWAKDAREIISPAVEGTLNIMAAAKEAGVEKVIYTSSCNTVGFTKDPEKPLNEESWNEHAHGPYVRAKNRAEAMAWRMADELGVPTVALLPTAVLGRFDYRLTPTTKPVIDAINGKGPIPFALNLLDVRDNARAHVLAAEKGKPGERYLVGGENVSMAGLADLIEELTGTRPRQGMGPKLILWPIAAVSEIVSHFTEKDPIITRAVLADGAGRHAVFDCSKMREELGLEPRGALEVMEEVIRWALFVGAIREPPAEKLKDKYPPDPEWPPPLNR